MVKKLLMIEKKFHLQNGVLSMPNEVSLDAE